MLLFTPSPEEEGLIRSERFQKMIISKEAQGANGMMKLEARFG